ncbi:MAG: hypothetical protein WA624_13900 [Methylocella sp.]
MAEDMNVWFGLVKDAVGWLADEEKQRRSWYGHGPEVSSPSETFESFLGDAAVEEYLKRDNTGLNKRQLEALTHLTKMMRKLRTETPGSIDRKIGPAFIDDPRWKEVIKTAKETLSLL